MKTIILIFLSFTTLLAFSNSLIDESSPYLQQHAYNPIEWEAWNEDSLERAKKEHKPIFLSIGYSTCHWCHVMAKESFEDEEVAELLNNYFIPIKVDREELPHLDSYYQELHQKIIHRSGGWPLTSILTEDAKPFFVGTYIPKTTDSMQEGLMELLPKIHAKYKNNKSKIKKQAEAIASIMSKKEVPSEFDNKKLNGITLFSSVQKQYDYVFSGFSKIKKFPEASKIKLLLTLGELGNNKATAMALDVLRTMALGGIYDQVDGGFFRYANDAEWIIPHFEKMLYNQAELLPLYLKAYQITNDILYKNIIFETIQMLKQRFIEEELFFSASDADSNHKEGGFFVYRVKDIVPLVKTSELKEALNLSEDGNFEHNSEHINFYLSEKRPKGFKDFREALIKLRINREYPFIDKKIITAWNAMMIDTLFQVSILDSNYLNLAQIHLNKLLQVHYIKGKLYHHSINGYLPFIDALLEDYAFLISALISAYEATYKHKYLELAVTLTNKAIELFYQDNTWYLSDDNLKIVADLKDKYYTSALGKMLQNLQRLSSLTASLTLQKIANNSLKSINTQLQGKQADAPASAIAYLMREKGVVTLKQSRDELLKHRIKIAKIKYPFIVTKVENSGLFLACKIGSCFAYSKDFIVIKSDIEKLIP
ncbi:MAG: DUF255 domain-containing protein [Helicobacteraceae bacterium]|nr:DUF255 domain-containing protein [Helicobacteraceae bacterium]